MMRALSHIVRSDRGTSTIELALVLPVLSVMTLASIDFAMAFGTKMQLQQFAQSGADFVVAGGETVPEESDVQAEVATVSGLAAEDITVTRFTECNAVKVADFGLCPGASDIRVDYMEIEVADSYEPFLSVDGISDFLDADTPLTGSVVVRLP